MRAVWEDTRNPYDNGPRRNWAELCCGWVGGLPPEKSAALTSDEEVAISDEEAMLPSQPADRGRTGVRGAAEASRLERGEGSGTARGGSMGLVAGHQGQEMLPMAEPQLLPSADEARAALAGGGDGGGSGGEASEDWATYVGRMSSSSDAP